MSARARLWPLVVLALLPPGCASMRSGFRTVPPGVRTIGNAYTVEPSMTWSRSFLSTLNPRFEMWTIDGTGLETLRFYTGVPDGDPLISGGANQERRPRFRAAMTTAEVGEMVAESIFGSRYPPRNVRPAPFGGTDGFRFEVNYASTSGVKREALVAGAVLDKRLYVIVYEGTALYHFGKYRDEVEHILASVRLKPPATR